MVTNNAMLMIVILHGYSYNDNDNNNMDISDPKFNFYIDIVDSLHFYIHHLYNTGFRLLPGSNDKDILYLALNMLILLNVVNIMNV